MTAFEQLLDTFGVRSPTTWAAPLLAACSVHEINTPLRMAAFLANVLHETGNLSELAEDLNYTPAAILSQWSSHFTPALAQKFGRIDKVINGRKVTVQAADQQQIAEHAYGGRYGNGPIGSGDGWLLRGHGGMMTTFRANYIAFGKTIGWTQPVEDLPAYLVTVQGAVDSATMFFEAAGCNSIADRGDIAAVRKVLNGGTIGLADVHARYPIILAALHNAQRIVAPVPVPPPIIVRDDDNSADDLNAQELTRIRSAA